MRTAVVIPARYASTRFPGKPLAILGGKPVLQWVWEAACNANGGSDCFVATDDVRIADAAASGFGANVVMTSADCHSGTDRCGEVIRQLRDADGTRYDLVINVQGDEPFIRPCDIESLAACFADAEVHIATLRRKIDDAAELLSPDCVKVVTDSKGQALYFSRLPIPFRRDIPQERWLDGMTYYKHIGMYAFRTEVLMDICALPQSPLETCEKLEQLRWLEAGYRICVADTDYEGVGIDTPADLARAKDLIGRITH